MARYLLALVDRADAAGAALAFTVDVEVDGAVAAFMGAFVKCSAAEDDKLEEEESGEEEACEDGEIAVEALSECVVEEVEVRLLVVVIVVKTSDAVGSGAAIDSTLFASVTEYVNPSRTTKSIPAPIVITRVWLVSGSWVADHTTCDCCVSRSPDSVATP